MTRRQALLAASALPLASVDAAQAAVPYSRGVWVAGPQHNQFWRSVDSMARHLADWRTAGVTDVYLCCLNHGRTHWPSAAMAAVVGEPIAPAFAGRDPLQEAISAASAQGMRVFAWLEFGFASHHTASGHSETVLSKRPRWAALNRAGQPVVKNGFAWLNAFSEDVQAWMTGLCVELAQQYPQLAGIQGDDRLPAQPVEAGHNREVLLTQMAMYREPPPSNDRDARWVSLRAMLLTHYLERLRGALQEARPDCLLSLAPSPMNFGLQEYLQDWPTWYRLGLADEFIPQLYRREIGAYARLLAATVAHTEPKRAQAPLLKAGMLWSLGQKVEASPELLTQMTQASRAAGLAGEVLFHSVGVEQLLPT